MKPLFFAILVLVSTNVLAEGQVASLVNFESTAIRPDTENGNSNVTSILNTAMEYTTPSNVSFYGGFSFILGEDFESAVTAGSRFYSSTPAFQVFPGLPMWSFIGGGISFFDKAVYYPEAGFRIATSDTSRLDVYIKILNSSSDVYNEHFMIGAGLTF
ncbi:hypothetical protein [Marinomonas colpomeniae]|uniref:Outer membrane protein beta-barrel domain-containing protein n=1 Tax=Marinomonas colpomeniae TaxID=2774408 RepID=A0ABR8P448_9GAMM|nr:hypothetical protein [Marinomonas colpomeniae]MBD5772599.1 hypothetical protein [Marinomonas colpomeniae]